MGTNLNFKSIKNEEDLVLAKNVNVTYTTSTEKVIDNKEKEESYSTEMYVDKDDVSDFDC